MWVWLETIFKDCLFNDCEWVEDLSFIVFDSADDVLKATAVDKLPNDMEGMELTMERLLSLINDVYKYVDSVVVSLFVIRFKAKAESLFIHRVWSLLYIFLMKFLRKVKHLQTTT